jgi:hypothetical protein
MIREERFFSDRLGFANLGFRAPGRGAGPESPIAAGASAARGFNSSFAAGVTP